jgi:hypothetical protein
MKLIESILGHRVQIIGLRLKGKVVDFHTEDCAIVRWDAGYTSHIGARLIERIADYVGTEKLPESITVEYDDSSAARWRPNPTKKGWWILEFRDSPKEQFRRWGLISLFTQSEDTTQDMLDSIERLTRG